LFIPVVTNSITFVQNRQNDEVEQFVKSDISQIHSMKTDNNYKGLVCIETGYIIKYKISNGVVTF